MRVPVSWLKDFIGASARVEGLADALTTRGLTVDAVEPQPTPQRIVIGLVEKLERHPNADRLLVGTVDVGTEKLQIVTGATNVSNGDRVPIALVGASVFEHGSTEGAAGRLKTILKSSLRGVESNGMMCSATELALPGEFEDGILIMEADAPVGEDFWTVARFGDAVLDVDVPANRADCLSIVGIAREAAAGLHLPWSEPDLPAGTGAAPSPIAVEITDPSVCRRLLGQTFTGFRGGRAPMWMTLRLHAAGVRSLNHLIDISNYVQIETGQPLHFYDAGLVRGGRIIARAARSGEKVVTLDGIERDLPDGTPVIADGEGVVGIAGIFGGAGSGVTAQTADVFVESPNFVGKRIRRAALALGLRTEGAARHEKDLPLQLPELGRRVAARLLQAAGGQPSAVVEAGEKPPGPRTIAVRAGRVNALLGTSYTPAQMREAIAPIGLQASGEATLSVSIPWWRNDLVEEVDIAEEVARSAGYDEIAEREIVASPQEVDEGLFERESIGARAAQALGYREVVTLALQGSRVIAAWERSGIPFWPDRVGIRNPLSDEQRFLRPSLLPGILSVAERSWNRGAGLLRLFEIGNIFRPLDSGGQGSAGALAPDGESRGAYAANGVHEWPSLCALAVFDETSEEPAVDRRLLEIKGEVEAIVRTFETAAPETAAHPRAFFHPGAASNLSINGAVAAKFGRIHPLLARAYDLPESSYAFMLYLENLPTRRPIVAYRPPPRFPGTSRDIAVVVDDAVGAGDLLKTVRTAGVALLEDASAFDEYRGPQVGDGKKSVAMRVVLRKPDATITDAEADAGVAIIVSALKKDFGARLRG